jgi:hypothetical protein
MQTQCSKFSQEQGDTLIQEELERKVGEIASHLVKWRWVGKLACGSKPQACFEEEANGNPNRRVGQVLTGYG